MGDGVQITLSVIAGSAVSGFLARAMFTKVLKDLEEALSNCEKLAIELAKISTKVEAIQNAVGMVYEHDRQIAQLQAKVQARSYGRKQNGAVHSDDS